MTVETPPLMGSAPKRLDHIQALRGIAALMVVVSHLLIIERKYSVDQILGDWASYGMAGVDLFFVISGFIMVYVMWDRPRGVKAAGEFLWGRASRIYPLYWIVSLVLLALWFVRPDMVFSSIDAPPDILKSFALFPDEREPLLAVGWTLVHEMYFYFVFAVIMLLPRDALMPCLIGWIFAVFLGRSAMNIAEINNSVMGLIFNPLTLEFIGGAVAGWIFKARRLKIRSGPASILSHVILAIGLILFFGELTSGDIFPTTGLPRVDAFAVPAVMIVYGLAARDWVNVTVWKPLVTLGDWSYALYLTHVLSLTVMGRIWAAIEIEGLFDNVIILIVMVAITIFISGLVYKYIERPIIKAARKQYGRPVH